MSRRKGEKPVIAPLDRWSPDHPVAHMIATGSKWFSAWVAQKATPIFQLARKTGIKPARLMALEMGDYISRAELDAISVAWGVSTGDLIASMPDPSLVID